jgi:hypothetical protein
LHGKAAYEMRSNDLFDRANQRAVGLIGRVRKLNSPYGRAQRGRTINIPTWFFPILGVMLLFFEKNAKKKVFINQLK